ncbi:hypothetical protein CIHG_09641 [Coccidioides immitis H538.4]|uniref:Uncharacterized protein n=1 Tax=Coccidioides immitis H538.4 TaxID=396776 RepID=A0A0J8UV90_COCIT|nr:hypothetical protein CIHG_09641 [Coccidioides immitis H538.4]
MSLRLLSRAVRSEKNDGSRGKGSPLYIPRNGAKSQGAGLGFQGCSPQAFKHGAAANNIRGRSLKIELMQHWCPFHSCRMRITVGRDKRTWSSIMSHHSRAADATVAPADLTLLWPLLVSPELFVANKVITCAVKTRHINISAATDGVNLLMIQSSLGMQDHHLAAQAGEDHQYLKCLFQEEAAWLSRELKGKHN